jgi:myo-inositol 2-dehydrogenase/D-chiro-inositol 1-dehydrogenase
VSAAPPLAVAVVGCGDVARTVHLPVLRALPGVRVAALADPDAARRSTAHALVPAARAHDSLEALLADVDVDAVVVAAPTAAHADLAIAVLDGGKHLYLEKPIATTLHDARRVLDAWRRARRVGMTGFNYRANPLLEAAHARLGAGAIGRIVAIRTVFSTYAPDGRHPGAWRRARASGGGALLDLASHHVDLVRWLSGEEIVRVSAHVRSHRAEDDTATLLLELSGGSTADVLVSLTSSEDDRVEIYGDAGRLVVDRYRSHSVRVEPLQAGASPIARVTRLASSVRALPYALAKRRSVAHEPSFSRALRTFVECARDGRRARPDLADGAASLAVILAAEEAAHTGAAVDVAAFSPTGSQPSDALS